VAFKIANTVIEGIGGDITFTTNQSLSRGCAATISGSYQLAGEGYSLQGQKVLTSAGRGYSNTTIDNGTFLLFCSPFTPQQGTISGYSSGGNPGPGPVDTIDKFPFTSDTSASDVGELTQAREFSTGHSSSVSGYTAGGSTPTVVNTIDKFSFSSDANATDVGEINALGFAGITSGIGNSSRTDGFITQGLISPSPSTPASGGIQERFPFSSDTGSTCVGALNNGRRAYAGQNSIKFGYVSGGYNNGPVLYSNIDKFPFASVVPSINIGSLTQARCSGAGQSSDVSGYTSGGGASTAPPAPPSKLDTIDKFSFASDANATDVGELSQARTLAAGQSSTVNGFTSSGCCGAPAITDTIDKFPFAADVSAADVGEVTSGRRGSAGQQSGGNA